MKKAGLLRYAIMASAAALALTGCSDTTIDSPGAATPVPPPPPPPPPPPAAATVDLVPTAGCPTGTTQVTLAAVAADGFSDIDVCSIGTAGATTNITSDLTIPAGSTIAIQGPTFIGEDGGTSATLTIEEGVRLFGGSADGTATATDDYLVITRGSQIVANGTEAAPIRFTARAAINDEETGSSIIEDGTNGQWGGLVINGFGEINDCTDAAAAGGTAACTKQGEGASGTFGGDDNTDSSGSLQYVIVEYAGSRLTNDDELNGIAFQGVGNGTDVDFVQVHNNLDDGIEWFGGAVNVKYAVVTGAGDDSLDWTDGWTGSLQFAAVKSTIPSSDDPRGIEADNQRPNDLTPFSDPTVSNVTLVGTTGNQQGALLRRGTRGDIMNGIIVDYGSGIDVDDDQSFTNIGDGTLAITSWFIDTAEPLTQDDDPFAPVAADNIESGDNSLIDEFFPGQQELGVDVTDVPADAFFTDVDYIGAFSSTETLADNWANFALAGTLFPETTTDPATCPTGTTDAGEVVDGKIVCQLIAANGAVTGEVALTDGDEILYELVGPVFVGIDRGPDAANPEPGSVSGTLSIEQGVTVVGDGNDDYLVVSRGSRILSNGTEDAPVVFTAKGAVDGTISVDNDTKGLWGGLVINGRAPINDCTDATAAGGSIGCEKQGEGASGEFGGADTADDSGQLFYTRVQYAGVRLTNDDELNGIAFQGVGSSTEAEFLQVYNNLDDCFEWFGGNISVKNVVALGCGDDSLDWTDGWQGSLQYAIVYPGEGDLSDDPRGIEGDNQRPNDLTPFSLPRVSNFTIINSGDAGVDRGAVLRRGMGGTIANGIIVGFDGGLQVRDDQTLTNINAADTVATNLRIKSLFLDNTVDVDQTGQVAYAPVAADNIETALTNTLSGFSFRAGRQGVVPGDNENGVAVFDVAGIGELEATTYIGAVEDATDTWFLGWTVDETGAETSN